MGRRVLIIGSNRVLVWQMQHELYRRDATIQIAICNQFDRQHTCQALKQKPDIIILIRSCKDVQKSIRLYEQIKRNKQTASIPVFIVTDQSDGASPSIRRLKNGDYQLTNNAFVAYTLADLMRSIHVVSAHTPVSRSRSIPPG